MRIDGERKEELESFEILGSSKWDVSFSDMIYSIFHWKRLRSDCPRLNRNLSSSVNSTLSMIEACPLKFCPTLSSRSLKCFHKYKLQLSSTADTMLLRFPTQNGNYGLAGGLVLSGYFPTILFQRTFSKSSELLMSCLFLAEGLRTVLWRRLVKTQMDSEVKLKLTVRGNPFSRRGA